jgi:protein arginine kinase
MNETQKMINDVAVSSRVRLARNIDGLPFPHKLSDDSKLDIASSVFAELNKDEQYKLYTMAELSSIDYEALKEKYLISSDLIDNKESGAVIVNKDETVAVMINEEDHIRAQSLLKGSCLSKAYDKISAVDNNISKKLNIAFSREYGYLTCCPTNLGTGMRASVMLFLPALTINRRINELIASVNKLHLTVRGNYGEGSAAAGHLYQLSNQISLGVSEDDIIKTVDETVEVICVRECEERERLVKQNSYELKDKIMRSWGVLTNAYKIDTSEFMSLMSDIKLGASIDIIKLKDPNVLNDLLTLAQPANLTQTYGKPMSPVERDIYRAEFVSNTLKMLQE